VRPPLCTPPDPRADNNLRTPGFPRFHQDGGAGGGPRRALRKDHGSMRATFFSIGLFVGLWGTSLLFVDRMVLTMTEEPQQQQREQGFRGLFSAAPQQREQQKIIDPPEWAAFSLMSIGSVTMLYSLALPKKKQG
jgi:hypothetical protein